MRFILELDGPEFAAGAAVKCAEAVVIGCAEKHEAAGGDDRPSHAGPPRIFFAFGQFVRNSGWHAPCEISGVGVNGDEFTPRRFLAGPAAAHHWLSVRTCHSS